MKKEELKEANYVGTEIIQLIVDLNKLNKKQLEYLGAKFDFLFEKEKLEKIEEKLNNTLK